MRFSFLERLLGIVPSAHQRVARAAERERAGERGPRSAPFLGYQSSTATPQVRDDHKCIAPEGRRPPKWVGLGRLLLGRFARAGETSCW
jgi:hypothetical protein